jgi:hypothetical protein
MLYLNMKLHLLTCIEILDVPVHVGIGTWFISYPIRVGHLCILLPLSQAHHYTKLGKEYCASIQFTCIHHFTKSKKILNFEK